MNLCWWNDTWGKQCSGLSDLESNPHCTWIKHMKWRRGRWRSSLTHKQIWKTQVTGNTETAQSSSEKTQVTGKYSVPPPILNVSLSLQVSLKSQSIFSFWGQLPWHYGDPWCRHPAAERQMKEKQGKRKTERAREKVNTRVWRSKVSWTEWREALWQASSYDWALHKNTQHSPPRKASSANEEHKKKPNDDRK